MGWFRDLIREWKARRAGAKHLPTDIRRAARDIIGPTGWQWSGGWSRLEQHGDAYVKSFDPRVPRSIHLAKDEQYRQHIPIPLAERCIEDWRTNQKADPTVADFETDEMPEGDVVG